MTWVAAASTYNYGLIVSDHRLSWDIGGCHVPESRFGVLKVALVAPNILGAFAGSVDIGLDVLGRLAALSRGYMTRAPSDMYHHYGQYLFQKYATFPYAANLRELGCDLLFVGLVPPDIRQFHFPALDEMGGPFSDLTSGYRVSCPTKNNGWGFEEFGVDLAYPGYDLGQGATRHIGSGSEHARYQELLDTRLAPARVQELGSMLKAGPQGPGLVQTAILEEDLPSEVDPSVSRTLHVSTVDRDGAVLISPKEFEDGLPLATDAGQFRMLSKRYAPTARGLAVA